MSRKYSSTRDLRPLIDALVLAAANAAREVPGVVVIDQFPRVVLAREELEEGILEFGQARYEKGWDARVNSGHHGGIH